MFSYIALAVIVFGAALVQRKYQWIRLWNRLYGDYAINFTV